LHLSPLALFGDPRFGLAPRVHLFGGGRFGGGAGALGGAQPLLGPGAVVRDGPRHRRAVRVPVARARREAPVHEREPFGVRAARGEARPRGTHTKSC
jgi:hypothetical protein